MGDLLLALNCGSSSLKFRLFSWPDLEDVGNGQASSIGSEKATLKVQGIKEGERSIKGEDHKAVFQDLLEELGDVAKRISVVCHRIVHGGQEDEPMLVYKGHTEALEKLEALSAFAPLHNHHAVLVVKVVLDKLSEAKNVLCFDTLFHRSLPPEVYTYAVPKPKGETPIPIRRYGFHGLSYASILKSVSKHLKKPAEQVSLVICHLGSGASMCAVKDGKSVETTMGLTPLEGLIGGTRSGSLDPSLLFHLYKDAAEAAHIEEKGGIKITDAERVLNKESGLQALAGTNDYGEISKKAAEGGEKEQLAVKVFENRVLHYLGAYLFLLDNKPDAVVFSGGIGEKSVELRASIAKRLGFLGIDLDESANERATKSEDAVVELSKPSSAFRLLRCLTDEERECAELAKDML